MLTLLILPHYNMAKSSQIQLIRNSHQLLHQKPLSEKFFRNLQPLPNYFLNIEPYVSICSSVGVQATTLKPMIETAVNAKIDFNILKPLLVTNKTKLHPISTYLSAPAILFYALRRALWN